MSDINNHRLLEPLTYDAVIDNGVTEPLPYFKERGLFKPSLSTTLTTYIDGNARESSLIIDDIIVVAQSSAPYLLMYQSTDSGNTYEILEDLSPVDQISGPAKYIKVNSKGTGFSVVHFSGNNMYVSFYKKKANKFIRIHMTAAYDVFLDPNALIEIDSYQNNDLEYVFIGRYTNQLNLLAFKIVNDSVTELDISTILPDVGNNAILSLTINEQSNKLLFLYNGSKYVFPYHIDPTNDTFTNFSFTMGTEFDGNITPRFIRYKNNKFAVGFNTSTSSSVLGLRVYSVVATNSSMALTTVSSFNTSLFAQNCTGMGLSYDGKYCNLNATTRRNIGFNGSTYVALTANPSTIGSNILCYKGDKVIFSGGTGSSTYSINDANISTTSLTTNMNFFNVLINGGSSLISSLGNNSNRLVVSTSTPSGFAFYNRDVNNNYVYSATVNASAGETDFKISKDGTYVVCNGGTNPALFKYNGTTYAKVSATFTNPVNNLSHTDISLDNVFVVGGGRTTQTGNQTYLSLFRLASDVPTNIVTLSDADTRVTGVKFSKTGKYLVIGLNSGLGLGTNSTVIYVKSSNTYVSLTTLAGIRSTCIEFNSDDTKLLLGSGDSLTATNNLYIYNVNTTTNTFTLSNTINYGTTFTDLKLSPNNKYLSISKNSTVDIFRLKTDNTLVKCRTQLPVRNFAYINSEFIDDNSILFMADLNTGPVYANGFIFENSTNTINRLPLIKG